jgi:hypothetical protein
MLFALAITLVLQSVSGLALDFQFYRARVEPILVKKRPGFVPCYKCHSENAVRLFQPMPAGRTSYTEEESRKNFQAISAFVRPGEPLKSPFLIHPLAHEAGGDAFHSGGKHWASQDDADWKTLAEWVRGVKAASRK